MIGVVYSQLRNAQNTGFVIPNEEVDYFLRAFGTNEVM